MPKITALIHVGGDSTPALEKTLKCLHPCDEVLIIDHNSEKEEDHRKLAEQHGATYRKAIVGVDDGAYALDACNEWVLSLMPGESLSEKLQRSLEEWKKTEPGATIGYLLRILEETPRGRKQRRRELRLVNRAQLNWKEAVPGNLPNAPELTGDLVCFARDGSRLSAPISRGFLRTRGH